MSKQLKLCPFDDHEKIAVQLCELGWHSPNDAQWTQLEEWCSVMKELWNTRTAEAVCSECDELEEATCPEGIGYVDYIKQLQDEIKKLKSQPAVSDKVRELWATKLHKIYNPDDNSCSYTRDDWLAAKEVLTLLDEPEQCNECGGKGVKIRINSGQREFGGDASFVSNYKCPACKGTGKKGNNDG